jgi:hypothetical protein
MTAPSGSLNPERPAGTFPEGLRDVKTAPADRFC